MLVDGRKSLGQRLQIKKFNVAWLDNQMARKCNCNGFLFEFETTAKIPRIGVGCPRISRFVYFLTENITNFKIISLKIKRVVKTRGHPTPIRNILKIFKSSTEKIALFDLKSIFR